VNGPFLSDALARLRTPAMAIAGTTNEIASATIAIGAVRIWTRTPASPGPRTPVAGLVTVSLLFASTS
jgi:hypothetical protein